MSVADSLRAEQIERMRQLDVSARVDLAYQLGLRDLELYMATHGVGAEEARRSLRAARKAGRVHSISASE